MIAIANEIVIKRRDITLALLLVRSLRGRADNLPALAGDDAQFVELEQLLVDIDARTGKKDPSKRAKKAAKVRR